MIRDTSGQDTLITPRSVYASRAKKGGAAMLAIAFMGYMLWQHLVIASADRVISGDVLRFANVERGDLVRELVAQGYVIAASSPTLFAQESGIVQLQVKAGDVVKRGEVIARIISPALHENLARQQAALKRLHMQHRGVQIDNKRRKLELQHNQDLARVNLKAMRREKRRADEAVALALISNLDHEEAGDNLARAALVYQQARQDNDLEQESLDFQDASLALEIESQQLAVDALQRRVKELSIRSPVNGLIGRVAVEQRQAVTVNQALMTVVDQNAFEIEARVSENYAHDLAAGMQARVSVGAAQYAARLTAISPQVTNSEVVTRIQFLQPPPEPLRQNQRLSVSIYLQKIENTLKVSRGSFFDNFRGEVFRVRGATAERVNIQTGSRNLRELEIVDGLEEGDTIIISALDYVNDDQQLIISD
jgi:HlyD family secretion protein